MKEIGLKDRLARDRQIKLSVIASVTEDKSVKSVIKKFREKYGTKDVKKYYSKFDVAVVVEIG